MEPLQTWWATELYPSKDDENFGVAGDFEMVKATDAQATIAALQARVEGLEQGCLRDHVDSEAADAKIMKLEGERGMWLNERVDLLSRLEVAESQLTQRTAERDTARRRVDELEAREVDVVMLREDLEQRTAELERVRSLIKALPKVEGEIRVGKTMDDCWFIDNQDAGGLCGRYKDDGPKYAALLQHRQGMEG